MEPLVNHIGGFLCGTNDEIIARNNGFPSVRLIDLLWMMWHLEDGSHIENEIDSFDRTLFPKIPQA
jgi:hypothetical protein